MHRCGALRATLLQIAGVVLAPLGLAAFSALTLVLLPCVLVPVAVYKQLTLPARAVPDWCFPKARPQGCCPAAALGRSPQNNNQYINPTHTRWDR